MDIEMRKKIRDYGSPDIEGQFVYYADENKSEETGDDETPVQKSFGAEIHDLLKHFSQK